MLLQAVELGWQKNEVVIVPSRGAAICAQQPANDKSPKPKPHFAHQSQSSNT
jgi:hypothetical protein